MFIIFQKESIDLEFFASQLELMLKSGLNLNRSLMILCKQSRKDREKEIYHNLVKDIESGLTFAEALAGEDDFSDLFKEVVKAGEKSGNLVEVLASLKNYYSNKKELKKEIKKACFYPLTVITTVFAAAFFILKFILPTFIDLFNDFQGELPLITKLFLKLTAFFNNYLFLIIILIILLISILTIFYKSQKSSKIRSLILLKFPIISNLYRDLILTQIALYLSLFLKSGLKLISALDFLAEIISDEHYQEFIKNTTLNISKGASLTECFADKKYIPDLFYYLLMTGEESAQLETMLERAGEYYYQKLKEETARMLQYLEPLLISLTAIFVALLAAAVIMPMFQIYLII